MYPLKIERSTPLTNKSISVTPKSVAILQDGYGFIKKQALF